MVVTDILNETQPCFIESGENIMRDYPMALYQDNKGVYQIVPSKTLFIDNNWEFIARFKNKHQAITYSKYLTHHKAPSWHVYFDADKGKYVVMAQMNLHKINPRYKYVRPFSTTEEADKYVKDCNFYYNLNNESEEIKWNANRAEAVENEDKDSGVISSFEEAYKLVKEGKRILGRPRGSDIWINFSEKLNKLINEWEFHKEEYHLDVKVSSDKNLEEIMHAISDLKDVEEVVRR